MHELSFDKIETWCFQTGVGIPHGEDREGSRIIVLNLRKHKRDAKRLPQLKKFLIFCMETHARRFPDKKTTLLFDVSECGLSNVDMDLVKFLINSYKFYFPYMLGYILVFEMPWMMQAAWRIIKSWLSEGAVNKIKFVTKSDITDYVSPSQLMVQFGGDDPYVYDFDSEYETLRSECEEVWERDPLTSYEDEEEESLKQVRFAPHQPPSRQSRYGSEEEDCDRRQSLDNQLMKGSAISPGYRRRQVHRLISSQVQQPHDRAMSLPSMSQIWTEENTDNLLLISPHDELVFSGRSGEELLCTVNLTNTTNNVVAYKIKTTAPSRYKVRPNINLLDGKSKASVQVKLISGSSELVSQDKFLIQAYQFEEGTPIPDSAQLPNFWKTLSNNKSVEEYRLKCCYILEPTKAAKQSSLASDKDQRIAVLQAKVDHLVYTITTLHTTVNQFWYISIVILVLLILLILF